MAEKTEVENKVEEMEKRAAGPRREHASGTRQGARQCPDCKSEKVRRSQMRGLLERGLLKPLGMKAYRCERCDARFYRFGSRSQEKAPPGTSSNGGEASLK
jgi:hypothetical protein